MFICAKYKRVKSTLRPLCLLNLSVVCLGFLRANFLQNPKKNLGYLLVSEGCMQYVTFCSLILCAHIVLTNPGFQVFQHINNLTIKPSKIVHTGQC